MSKVLLRQFEEQDQDAVYALHLLGLKQTGSYIENPEARDEWDKDLLNIRETYLNGEGEFLVAHSGVKIVGMGALRKHDARTAEIKRMRVDPEFQGIGIGGRILDTSVMQVPAQHLYESRGFELYKRDIQYGQGMMYYEKEL